MKERSHLDVKYVANAFLKCSIARNIGLASMRERNHSNVKFVTTVVLKVALIR